jgi:hypothetical protein
MKNRVALTERFAADVAVEERLLERPTLSGYRRTHDAWRHACNDEALASEVSELNSAPRSFAVADAYGHGPPSAAKAPPILRLAIARLSQHGF